MPIRRSIRQVFVALKMIPKGRGAAAIFTLALLSAPLALDAASMRIYTEFRRVGPFGQVVTQDRGGTPREVISPAVGRNGYASFLIAVQAQPGSEYELHLGQNPDDTVELTLYRALYAKRGDEWIPDQLEPVEAPHRMQFSGISGQNTMLYWLDVWVPPGAKPGRIRVEAQLLADGYWVITPMEVRIQSTVFPRSNPPKLPVAAIEAPADQSAIGPWKLALCGQRAAGLRDSIFVRSIRSLIQRNAQQDVDLARRLERLEAQPKAAFCASGRSEEDAGPEWYLKLRNSLIVPVRPAQ